MRPRYTLASGLAQTWEWYRGARRHERALDCAAEDQLLALAAA